MSWALRGVNLLEWDVSTNYKRVYLGVDTSTMTVKLPDDCVSVISVGTINSNNEFMPLVYNDKIVITPETVSCDNEPHCSCGCTDELCYSIGQSNFETTTEDVVINGGTYTKTITICTASNGDIIKKTCEPVVTNPTQTCDYEITIEMGDDIIPFTNVKILKNNVEQFVGDIADISAMITLFDAYGFDTSGSVDTTFNAVKTGSSDVWGYVKYTTSALSTLTESFDQSNCSNPTPTVETYCHEETICNVPVKACGCIESTPTALNVLENVANINLAFISRWRYLKDFGQTFKTTPGYFGEYNINLYEQIIQLNWDFQYSNIYIEYMSGNSVDSKDYLIPAMAEEALAAYLVFKWKASRASTPAYEKRMAEKYWLNQKRLYRERINAINFDNLLQKTRVLPRP